MPDLTRPDCRLRHSSCHRRTAPPCGAMPCSAERLHLLQVAERVLGVAGGALQRPRAGARGVLCSAGRLVCQALGLQPNTCSQYGADRRRESDAQLLLGCNTSSRSSFMGPNQRAGSKHLVSSAAEVWQAAHVDLQAICAPAEAHRLRADVLAALQSGTTTGSVTTSSSTQQPSRWAVPTAPPGKVQAARSTEEAMCNM